MFQISPAPAIYLHRHKQTHTSTKTHICRPLVFAYSHAQASDIDSCTRWITTTHFSQSNPSTQLTLHSINTCESWQDSVSGLVCCWTPPLVGCGADLPGQGYTVRMGEVGWRQPNTLWLCLDSSLWGVQAGEVEVNISVLMIKEVFLLYFLYNVEVLLCPYKSMCV